MEKVSLVYSVIHLNQSSHERVSIGFYFVATDLMSKYTNSSAWSLALHVRTGPCYGASWLTSNHLERGWGGVKGNIPPAPVADI